ERSLLQPRRATLFETEYAEPPVQRPPAHEAVELPRAAPEPAEAPRVAAGQPGPSRIEPPPVEPRIEQSPAEPRLVTARVDAPQVPIAQPPSHPSMSPVATPHPVPPRAGDS